MAHSFFPYCFLAAALLLTILFSSPPVIMSTSRAHLLNNNNKTTGFRVSMTHVDSGSNLTKLERLQRAMTRGNNRLTYLNNLVSGNDLTSLVYPGNGEFLMKLSIGTPPKEFSAIMDTGSDLIWTQCMPCRNCYDQSTPIFDPTNSSSFSKLPCSSSLCGELSGSQCRSDGCEYTYAYGDYSTTEGIMATESFTFGDLSVANLGFGCGEDNHGSGFSQGAGLVGLGRGPLSLLSQLRESTFSYCLTSIDTAQTSTLSVGSTFASKGISGNNYKTTPLNNNPSQPSFYYLNLQGITIGNTSLPIRESSFGIRHDGSGGMIIDSGTTITYIENSVFEVVKREFINQVNLKVDESGLSGFDLCFELPHGVLFMEVPKLVFHFEDADLEIPGENYMLSDSSLGLMCLMMAGSSGMSIFGNLMQQNMLVVHDLSKETVSFVPTQCDRLNIM